MKLTQKVFYFFVFKPPVTMLLMLLDLLVLICASITFFTYRGINKKSIVERLRNNDEWNSMRKVCRYNKLVKNAELKAIACYLSNKYNVKGSNNSKIPWIK